MGLVWSLLPSCWSRGGEAHHGQMFPLPRLSWLGLLWRYIVEERWRSCFFPLIPNGHNGEILAQSVQFLGSSKVKMSALQFETHYKGKIPSKQAEGATQLISDTSFTCSLQWAKWTLILGMTCNLNTESELWEVFLAVLHRISFTHAHALLQCSQNRYGSCLG